MIQDGLAFYHTGYLVDVLSPDHEQQVIPCESFPLDQKEPSRGHLKTRDYLMDTFDVQDPLECCVLFHCAWETISPLLQD